MFDNNVFIDGSFKNDVHCESLHGFQLETYITYYRGIPLSMVHDVRIAVDGEDVPRDKIRFTVDHIDWFTLTELETVTTFKWEYGDKATVFIDWPGGLSKGAHAVSLTTAIRVAYIPVPFEGSKTRDVIVK